MKLYIFRKENEFDYERIPVEVLRVREKGIDIQKGRDIVTLRWDTEHTFPMICCDDIVNVYIIGDNFERGYVIEKFRTLLPQYREMDLLFKSELDKITEEQKCKIEMCLKFLCALLDHFKESTNDGRMILEQFLKSYEDNRKKYSQLKDTINTMKNEDLKQVRGEK